MMGQSRKIQRSPAPYAILMFICVMCSYAIAQPKGATAGSQVLWYQYATGVIILIAGILGLPVAWMQIQKTRREIKKTEGEIALSTLKMEESRAAIRKATAEAEKLERENKVTRSANSPEQGTDSSPQGTTSPSAESIINSLIQRQLLSLGVAEVIMRSIVFSISLTVWNMVFNPISSSIFAISNYIRRNHSFDPTSFNDSKYQILSDIFNILPSWIYFIVTLIIFTRLGRPTYKAARAYIHQVAVANPVPSARTSAPDTSGN